MACFSILLLLEKPRLDFLQGCLSLKLTKLVSTEDSTLALLLCVYDFDLWHLHGYYFC